MPESKKVRADLFLVKKGLVSSREKARGLILAGKVSSESRRIEKAGEWISEEALLNVEESPRFVSRGGIKLEHALRKFRIVVEGKVCLDVGASTGGFTDCLLQWGAKTVYAVDVGYGQFNWQLRKDPRIILLERTNFRYLAVEKIPEPVDLVVMDASFISLTKLLPRVSLFLKNSGEVLPLVKPQFELSPQEVKRGVVRSDGLREKAISQIEKEATRLGLQVLGRTPAPILGPKGNQEYFLHLLRR